MIGIHLILVKATIDRERKGTRRECHAYNTVQGGFVQGPPFYIKQYMDGNVFLQVRYQQLSFICKLSNTQQEYPAYHE